MLSSSSSSRRFPAAPRRAAQEPRGTASRVLGSSRRPGRGLLVVFVASTSSSSCPRALQPAGLRPSGQGLYFPNCVICSVLSGAAAVFDSASGIPASGDPTFFPRIGTKPDARGRTKKDRPVGCSARCRRTGYGTMLRTVSPDQMSQATARPASVPASQPGPASGRRTGRSRALPGLRSPSRRTDSAFERPEPG